MYNTASLISQRLGENEIEEYDRIFAPRIVATPLEDARRSICVLPDGEIRVYGLCNHYAFHQGTPAYIASRDGGLSWIKHYANEKDIGACVYVPWTKKYVTVRPFFNPETGKNEIRRYLSDIGPGDTSPDVATICQRDYIDFFQPVVLEDKKRLIACSHICESTKEYAHHYVPTLFISDDGGNTWQIKPLQSCPRFVQTPPHQGMRWENNGSEPTLTRLKDGRLWLLLRTAQNYMYECFSYDNGDTWTNPTPSAFHMTLTTPFALTLQDGRTVLFWNNTHPLPEQDKTKCQPPLPLSMQNGTWEDVFTNRDAAHAAITEDCGKTFIGYRETLLNGIRNRVDFRKYGTFFEGNDKSVHQFQAIELPRNKILVAAGQQSASRRLFIFDLQWLYETTREETFHEGMENVSVQGYLKSISGTYTGDGISGHCHWNRIASVLPMPDPAGSPNEALQFVYSDDPRLHNGLSGLAWNFPVDKKGRLELSLYRKSAGVRIRLSDVWINPTDEYADEVATFAVDVEKVLPTNEWKTVALEWDLQKGELQCLLDNKIIAVSKQMHDAPHGVCYVHLQTLARTRDFDGCYLRSLKKL